MSPMSAAASAQPTYPAPAPYAPVASATTVTPASATACETSTTPVTGRRRAAVPPRKSEVPHSRLAHKARAVVTEAACQTRVAAVVTGEATYGDRVSVQLNAPADLPAEFRRAVAGLAGVNLRPEVVVSELPAPRRLAPHAVALHAAVVRSGEELADGRLVVLHDPAGQDVWEGTTRCVAYVQAAVDVEIASDPLLPGVGWAWLVEALESADADHCAAGGTVTRTTSERFGALADHPAAAEVEIRASWSPLGDDLGPHLVAFGELLCAAAGLPPTPPGVVPMPTTGRKRASSAGARRR